MHYLGNVTQGTDNLGTATNTEPAIENRTKSYDKVRLPRMEVRIEGPEKHPLPYVNQLICLQLPIWIHNNMSVVLAESKRSFSPKHRYLFPSSRVHAMSLIRYLGPTMVLELSPGARRILDSPRSIRRALKVYRTSPPLD